MKKTEKIKKSPAHPHLSISQFFSIILTLTYLIGAVLVVFMVNQSMRKEAISDARQKTHMLLERNLATHHYFNQNLKPKLFESIENCESDGSCKSEDYFEPAWMSSTYAIRKIDSYYKTLDQNHADDFYYKECAINARSAENEADEFERAFIEKLNKNPDTPPISGERQIDGENFYVTLRRGETMEKACLKCHSTPDRAPGQLVEQYGPTRSFNRKPGEVVSAVSIRIPRAKAYADTKAASIKLSAILLVILGVMLAVQYFFAKKIILKPLKDIQQKSSEISFDPKSLGETIPLPRGKDLFGLASAFNIMSEKLRQSRNLMEQKIQQRTETLENLNQRLTSEIKERKEKENEINQHKIFLENIIESLDHPFYVLDANDYSVKLANSSTKRALKEGKITCTALLNNEKIPCGSSQHVCPVEHIHKTGKTVCVEHYHTDNLGNKIVAEVHAHPVFDQNGELSDVIEYTLDITERKQAEEAFRSNQFFLRKAQEIGKIGTWELDVVNNVLVWTDECYRIFGVSRDTRLTYELFLNLIHPDDREKVDLAWKEAIKGNPYDIDHRIVLDGKVKWIREKAVLLFDDGDNCIQATGFAQDITTVKEAKEREMNHQNELAHASRLSIMGQMSTELAHEINQPLYAILANAESALRAAGEISENDKLKEKIQAVIRQAERAGKIITRVKNFASKGQGKTSEVQINEIVSNALEFTDPGIKKYNVKIDMLLQKDIPPVNADAIKIEQVLINLIQNSLDSMGKKPLNDHVLTITTRTVDNFVEVAVKDTGSGISEDNLDVIFDPFVTSKENGLGMGLSISRSIIYSHGGKLSFRDNSQEGATMFFTIPVNSDFL